MLLVSFAQAQTTEEVDSLVNLHFEKVGGIDTWKQLKTYCITQSFFTNHESTSSNNSFLQSQLALELQKTYYQHPDQYRIELYRNRELVATLFANTDEVKINMAGFEEKWPNKKTRALLGNTQFYVIGPTLLMLEAAEKDSIAYEGLVEAYGKECHKLVFVAQGFTGKLIVYLDAETHLVHAASNIDSPENYKIYTDYRSVGGVTIPYKFSSYEKGGLYEEYRILEVEINEEMDDYLFSVW